VIFVMILLIFEFPELIYTIISYYSGCKKNMGFLKKIVLH